jgi:hypothetical protein
MPGVLHQRGDFLPAKARDFPRIEPRKSLAIGLALSQYRVPAQSGLRAFQDQEFEKAPVVVYRYTPFGVVIGGLQLIPSAQAQRLFMRRFYYLCLSVDQ